MKFSKVLPLLFDAFKKQDIDFALIGGIALYAHGIGRTTFDADFLILVANEDPVDKIMRTHGYKLLRKAKTFVSYTSSDSDMGRVDFMLAQKKYSTSMLERAKECVLLGTPVKVVDVEDMIGLKVLSSSNDPRRAQKDLWDIEDLMRRHHQTLDWQRVGEYFKLFGRDAEYRQLRKRTS